MAGEYSFRVVFQAGQEPRLEEVDPATPPGIYQVSGHDNSVAGGIPDNQVSVSIVRHAPDGTAVIGASGYRDA